MSTPKRCCNNPVQLVIVYDNDDVISVCYKHSQAFEYQRSVKWIFDYVTKKELNREEAFGTLT